MRLTSGELDGITQNGSTYGIIQTDTRAIARRGLSRFSLQTRIQLHVVWMAVKLTKGVGDLRIRVDVLECLICRQVKEFAEFIQRTNTSLTTLENSEDFNRFENTWNTWGKWQC